jgi:hypothetical protein
MGAELKAEKVIPPRRPLTKKIEDHSDPHLLPKHHPRARRRMAKWRSDKKERSTAVDQNDHSSDDVDSIDLDNR